MSTMEEYKAELADYLGGFAANVRRLRAEHDPPFSQTDLHNATNLHRTEIGRIENAEVEPRLATLAILADALDVPLDALIEGVPVPKERKPPPQAKEPLPVKR
jgi:transcriptional regulator with XRE-family HTH domain